MPKKQSPIYIEHNGETKTLQRWAEQLNIDIHTMRDRYKRGLRGDRLFAPVRKYEKRPRSIALPETTYQRLQFHMQRLNVTEEELVGKIFEVMLKRLDSHAIEQTKQSLISGE